MYPGCPLTTTAPPESAPTGSKGLEEHDKKKKGKDSLLVNPMFEHQARWIQVIFIVVPIGRGKKRGDLEGHHGIHQYASLKNKSGEITDKMSIIRNDTKLPHCEETKLTPSLALYKITDSHDQQ